MNPSLLRIKILDHLCSTIYNHILRVRHGLRCCSLRGNSVNRVIIIHVDITIHQSNRICIQRHNILHDDKRIAINKVSLVQSFVISNRRTGEVNVTYPGISTLHVCGSLSGIRGQEFPVTAGTRDLDLFARVKIRAENQSFVIHCNRSLVRSLRHGNLFRHVIRLDRDIRTTRLPIHVSIHVSRDLNPVIRNLPDGSNPTSCRVIHREIRGIRVHVKRIFMR